MATNEDSRPVERTLRLCPHVREPECCLREDGPRDCGRCKPIRKADGGLMSRGKDRRLTNLRPTVGAIDTRIARPAPKTADPFYLSPEWRKLVAGIIQTRGRRCEACGKTYEDDGQPVRLIGDHVHELRDGGASLDPGNVKLLCLPCHNGTCQ